MNSACTIRIDAFLFAFVGLDFCFRCSRGRIGLTISEPNAIESIGFESSMSLREAAEFTDC
ncbi:hypothetical protein PC129_g10071 [Phytophthora cactorum]|uniref:Uncharacterized protein n=1 Tax=Phytophthora cactorum TaxID=29920 RepID=A0A8T1I455_9STRA|nr:hypothetical protein PC129_g10071 [Phytophthora cactorum]